MLAGATYAVLRATGLLPSEEAATRTVDDRENAALWAEAHAALAAFVAADLRHVGQFPPRTDSAQVLEAYGLVDRFFLALIDLELVTPPASQVARHEAVLHIYWQIEDAMSGVIDAQLAGDSLRASLERERLALLVDQAAAGSFMLAPDAVADAELPGFHSRWLDQSAYPVLRPAEVSPELVVRFRNVGTRPWLKGIAGQHARLGIIADAGVWSRLAVNWPEPDRVADQLEPVVAPGDTGTFAFRLRAPGAEGTYRLRLSPVIDGTTWMEDEGVFLLVTVK